MSRTGLGVAVAVPNLLVLILIVTYLLVARFSANRVEPLVATDHKTRLRIAALEQALRRNPSDAEAPIELARLYRRAGEIPWSYDALRKAERSGNRDLNWRMSLALAYVDLGKNSDGSRVLKQALDACDVERCGAHVRAKIAVFQRLTELLAQESIDAGQDPARAHHVLRQVLKPVSSPGGGLPRRVAPAAAKRPATSPRAE